MHHLLDALSLPLFAAAALVFVSVLAGVVSTRAGFSLLLVFLVAGMLAGKDGPGGFSFNDFRLAFWVGNVALAVILLDGGLRTELATFRTGLRPSMLLATVGVALGDLVWPLLAILGLSWVESTYGDFLSVLRWVAAVIFLFMGGFMIGLAIEKWDLHRRIALGEIRADPAQLAVAAQLEDLRAWLEATANRRIGLSIRFLLGAR